MSGTIKTCKPRTYIQILKNRPNEIFFLNFGVTHAAHILTIHQLANAFNKIQFLTSCFGTGVPSSGSFFRTQEY